jgi:hypothetical protein
MREGVSWGPAPAQSVHADEGLPCSRRPLRRANRLRRCRGASLLRNGRYESPSVRHRSRQTRGSPLAPALTGRYETALVRPEVSRPLAPALTGTYEAPFDLLPVHNLHSLAYVQLLPMHALSLPPIILSAAGDSPSILLCAARPVAVSRHVVRR